MNILLGNPVTENKSRSGWVHGPTMSAEGMLVCNLATCVVMYALSQAMQLSLYAC
jgi:hypothetical protein